ncbi:MAG: arsenate reductase ArsC [Deltaproteobacteria bacterium]|nr:arsenate reductase ArsC [Deltaproteobacteria bacterium]
MAEIKKILFVCIGNSCRSQMAEGFARKFGEGVIEAKSAGVEASGIVNLMAINAMKEKGIDISSQSSTQITDEMLQWADVVITLGCCSADELCPVEFDGRKEDWCVDDPLGKAPEVMLTVTDEIEERVKKLIDEFRNS